MSTMNDKELYEELLQVTDHLFYLITMFENRIYLHDWTWASDKEKSLIYLLVDTLKTLTILIKTNSISYSYQYIYRKLDEINMLFTLLKTGNLTQQQIDLLFNAPNHIYYDVCKRDSLAVDNTRNYKHKHMKEEGKREVLKLSKKYNINYEVLKESIVERWYWINCVKKDKYDSFLNLYKEKLGVDWNYTHYKKMCADSHIKQSWKRTITADQKKVILENINMLRNILNKLDKNIPLDDLSILMFDPIEPEIEELIMIATEAKGNDINANGQHLLSSIYLLKAKQYFSIIAGFRGAYKNFESIYKPKKQKDYDFLKCIYDDKYWDNGSYWVRKKLEPHMFIESILNESSTLIHGVSLYAMHTVFKNRNNDNFINMAANSLIVFFELQTYKTINDENKRNDMNKIFGGYIDRCVSVYLGKN